MWIEDAIVVDLDNLYASYEVPNKLTLLIRIDTF
jgi:hypothetical protein